MPTPRFQESALACRFLKTAPILDLKRERSIGKITYLEAFNLFREVVDPSNRSVTHWSGIVLPARSG